MEHVAKTIAEMEKLAKHLPDTVPMGTNQDRIYRLVTSINEGSPWETFNRITDLLFKEDTDCRDENGRFRYLTRGKFGIGKFVSYLKNVAWKHDSMLNAYPLVKLRLDRVNDELKVLM